MLLTDSCLTRGSGAVSLLGDRLPTAGGGESPLLLSLPFQSLGVKQVKPGLVLGTSLVWDEALPVGGPGSWQAEVRLT